MGVHFNLFSDLNQRGPLGEKVGRGPSRIQGLWAWSPEYGPLLGNNWPLLQLFQDRQNRKEIRMSVESHVNKGEGRSRAGWPLWCSQGS